VDVDYFGGEFLYDYEIPYEIINHPGSFDIHMLGEYDFIDELYFELSSTSPFGLWSLLIEPFVGFGEKFTLPPMLEGETVEIGLENTGDCLFKCSFDGDIDFYILDDNSDETESYEGIEPIESARLSEFSAVQIYAYNDSSDIECVFYRISTDYFMFYNGSEYNSSSELVEHSWDFTAEIIQINCAFCGGEDDVYTIALDFVQELYQFDPDEATYNSELPFEIAQSDIDIPLEGMNVVYTVTDSTNADRFFIQYALVSILQNNQPRSNVLGFRDIRYYRYYLSPNYDDRSEVELTVSSLGTSLIDNIYVDNGYYRSLDGDCDNGSTYCIFNLLPEDIVDDEYYLIRFENDERVSSVVIVLVTERTKLTMTEGVSNHVVNGESSVYTF
ncbi:MAG: hypothetical protein NXI00_24025, partial [Cytophagales bacterium]|nr:hypothetical protein [Cytophagales bacterium]